jgi:hypothetical protein
MRALTLWAPWGTAIATLGKDVENRPWKPPDWILGERIAIHEGQTVDRAAVEKLEKKHGKLSFERGVVACTAVVRGWIDADGTHSESLTKQEAAAARRSRWHHGEEVGWVLGDVRAPAARVEIKGARQLWILPESEERKAMGAARSSRPARAGGAKRAG